MKRKKQTKPSLEIKSATKEEVYKLRLQLPEQASQILIKSQTFPAEARNELRDDFLWGCDWLLHGEMLSGDEILPTMLDFKPTKNFDFLKLYDEWMKRLKAEFDLFFAKDMSHDQWMKLHGEGTRYLIDQSYDSQEKAIAQAKRDRRRVFLEQECAARFVALSAEQVKLHQRAAKIYKDKDLANTSAAMANVAKPRRRRKTVDEAFWEAEEYVWESGWPGRNALADIIQCSTKVIDIVIKNSTLLKAARDGIPREQWRRTKPRSPSYIEKHKKIAKSCIEKDIYRGKKTCKDAKTILAKIDELTVDSAGIVDTWLKPRNKAYLVAEKKNDYTYDWIDDTSDIIPDRDRAKDGR